MNCNTCHDLLQQRLDAPAVSLDPALEQHLRDCPRCRALDAAAGRLTDGLRLLAPPVPPVDLANRIVGRVLAARRARRQVRRRVLAVLAVAASLLLGLGLRFFPSGPEKGRAPSVPPVASKKPQPVPPAPPEGPKLRESVAEAGEAVAAWTARTAGEAVGETRLLLPPMPTPSLDLPSLDPPTAPLKEAGAGVTAGLQPVTDSWRRAAGMFLREVPPMPLSEKTGS